MVVRQRLFKGDFEMTYSINGFRQQATVLAGAFVSAFLLVSAATSLPIV